MFDANIRTGLFITATHFVVVLDMLTSMERRDNKYEETPLESGTLFMRAGSEVMRQRTDLDKILTYLKILPQIWAHSLPYDGLKAFMPFVVGALSDAEFETIDGDDSNYAASA
ncbi:MAG TPA: hypothetical protein PK156_22680 [Polyangium sp.]|nr:hypothetical protein [Polyangium sp.]